MPSYQGTTQIAGLGTVAFPPGEWLLEFRRIEPSTSNYQLPDYHVFKRKGDRLERLTILRYLQTDTPRQLALMLDTVGETLGDGVPWPDKKEKNPVGEMFPLRTDPAEPKLTERHLGYSFIHSLPQPAASWICHTHLFLQDNAVIIIAHASTSVITPEVVSKVQSGSRFLKVERNTK